jgi:hypothetical protein
MTHQGEPGDRKLPERDGAAVPTTDADEAANHLGQEDADIPEGQQNGGAPASDERPHSPSGLASGLQKGGTIPGMSPGATVGSLGTGGGSTANRSTGAVKKGL